MRPPRAATDNVVCFAAAFFAYILLAGGIAWLEGGLQVRHIKRALSAAALLLALTLLLTGCFSMWTGKLLGEVARRMGDDKSSSDFAPPAASAELRDDYYQAVNGPWLEQAVIGNGVPAVGSFSEVSMQTTTDLLAVLMELGEKAEALPAQSNERLLADFFSSAMDYAARNADGLAPIMPFLNALDQARTLSQLTDALIMMDNAGIGSFVTWEVSADLMDSSKNVLYLSTAYIGLPRKEYYHDRDTASVAGRTAYTKYLTRLFSQLPQYRQTAADAARSVVEFETSLTQAYWNAEEWNTVGNIYNPRSLEEIAEATKAFDSRRFFEQTGISAAGHYVVACPPYLDKLGELYTEQNLGQLKQYATAMVLSQACNYLTAELEAAQTEFDNAVNGSLGSLEDIEQAYNTVNQYMGELLGRIYAEQLFGEQAKAEAQQIADLVISTYEQRILALDWMSAQTKEKAVKKLETMRVKVGYPDHWEDYSDVAIRSYGDGGSLYGNIMGLYKRLCAQSLAKLNQPVDRSDWQMTSHTVNAYYSPTGNEIVFPAAILQAPFFDVDAPLEENLGGIGSIIAHEVSHAFDDTGAQFDENGNLANWWTEQDLAAYRERTQRLVRQFEEIEAAPGEYINGTLTLGENIADLGGLSCVVQIATEQGLDLDALFRSYARAWRGKATPEYTSYLLKTDSHSPDKYRVNQILKNIEEFYQTYGVQPTDGMYLAPEERVSIW